MAPIDAPPEGRKRLRIGIVKESYPASPARSSAAATCDDDWPGDEALAEDKGLHPRLWGDWSDESVFGIGAEGGGG